MRKMHHMRRLSLAVLAAMLLPLAAAAQQPLHWEASIESASRIAAASNRSVLVLFSAPWCSACRALENDMLSDGRIAAALDANYVLVKLNVDYFRATAQQYGITSLPTTVILAATPRGDVLDMIVGRVPMSDYVGRLNQLALNVKRPAAPTYAQIPAASVQQPGATPAAPSGQTRMAAAPATPAASDSAAAVRSFPPTLGGPAPAGLPASAAAGSVHHPPLGLDGYCPVQLVEKASWRRGDTHWGAIHRGRTYLFSGPEEQRRFLAAPDRYAPVNSGEDIVLAVEQRRSVPGDRIHGVFYAGHVYLFADEASLLKFSRAPKEFADRALALHAETASAAPVR
jgi:YHS domain-containing protein/thiol-disulfide isomerase/thioredoxin